MEKSNVEKKFLEPAKQLESGEKLEAEIIEKALAQAVNEEAQQLSLGVPQESQEEKQNRAGILTKTLVGISVALAVAKGAEVLAEENKKVLIQDRAFNELSGAADKAQVQTKEEPSLAPAESKTDSAPVEEIRIKEEKLYQTAWEAARQKLEALGKADFSDIKNLSARWQAERNVKRLIPMYRAIVEKSNKIKTIFDIDKNAVVFIGIYTNSPADTIEKPFGLVFTIKEVEEKK